MTPPDEPTLSELRRRLEENRSEMSTAFSKISDRLDKLPTANELTLQFDGAKAQISSVVRDLKRVEDAGNKRMDGLEKDQEDHEAKLEANRKWLVSIALTGAGVLIGLGGFILSVVAK